MNMEKIDFVLMWVDDSDPEWQARKKHFEAFEERPSYDDANGDWRFRDYGLLRYWFRAVERFAPWVNQVFFITCGQHPEWLNQAAPKLRLVNHEDFMPPDYLPTFNAAAIELNLHRIGELSEHFVLFNDDMFIVRPAKPECFFKKGLPVLPCNIGVPSWIGYNSYSRTYLNDSGFVRQHLDVERLMWSNVFKWTSVPALGLRRALKNLLSFSINRFVFVGGFGHLALPHLKSTLSEIWEANPRVLDWVSHHKFRRDDRLNQWCACNWNIVKGNFHPIHERRMGKYINLSSRTLDEACRQIRNPTVPQLCLNDSRQNDIPERCFSALKGVFDELLPDKSSFEN